MLAARALTHLKWTAYAAAIELFFY